MPRDKTASHIRLMAAARQEFLERGFEKASMRSIGKRCGMTAAGIYRHCRDKEDLFDQLVLPCKERLEEWLKGHVSRYIDLISKGSNVTWIDSWVDMMREVVYPNMEDYHLLLSGSGGTKYEDYLHDLTEQHQQEMMNYMALLRAEGYTVRDIDKNEMHLLLTAYMTALFEPVIHNYTQKEALHCLETVEVFFLPGWKNLFGL